MSRKRRMFDIEVPAEEPGDETGDEPAQSPAATPGEPPASAPKSSGGERIAKRKLMNMSISCDHRVVDGWDAASFIQAVKRLIESPALLLAN